MSETKRERKYGFEFNFKGEKQIRKFPQRGTHSTVKQDIVEGCKFSLEMLKTQDCFSCVWSLREKMDSTGAGITLGLIHIKV